MKCEIEVELPEHIAKDWEVARIGTPVDGDYVVTPAGNPEKFIIHEYDSIPRVILRRKLNPRDWWPTWVLADTITLEINGIIRMHGDNGNSAYWTDTSGLVDFSWIPEHLKRSGVTIENPWKGEQQ